MDNRTAAAWNALKNSWPKLGMNEASEEEAAIAARGLTREQYYAMDRSDRILLVAHYRGTSILTGLHSKYQELEREAKRKHK